MEAACRAEAIARLLADYTGSRKDRMPTSEERDAIVCAAEILAELTTETTWAVLEGASPAIRRA
jgi:sugar (pentulose or hexulose) kinase